MKITKSKFNSSRPAIAACDMPTGLNHHPDKSAEFDYSKSEVVQWLIANPEIQRFIFEKIRTSGAIIFDQESKTWRGKNRFSPMESHGYLSHGHDTSENRFSPMVPPIKGGNHMGPNFPVLRDPVSPDRGTMKSKNKLKAKIIPVEFQEAPVTTFNPCKCHTHDSEQTHCHRPMKEKPTE